MCKKWRENLLLHLCWKSTFLHEIPFRISELFCSLFNSSSSSMSVVDVVHDVIRLLLPACELFLFCFWLLHRSIVYRRKYCWSELTFPQHAVPLAGCGRLSLLLRASFKYVMASWHPRLCNRVKTVNSHFSSLCSTFFKLSAMFSKLLRHFLRM